MDNNPSLNEQLRRAEVEKMWLNYFNNTLPEQGIITPQQHHKMKVQIATRKSGSPTR